MNHPAELTLPAVTALVNAGRDTVAARRARAAAIADYLAARFPETPVPLHHRDAYTLLIAVLLSAQCTDERVNTVTPHLFALAGGPAEMATLPVSAVQAVIRPCGLAPQKAKAIVELSRLLVSQHGGVVPVELEALQALPGVGRKTALVVRSQWFGLPAFPVDTHIHRLAQRWKFTSGRNVRQTEADLCRLFPEESWNQLHLRIIFYGRAECQARQCDGLHCVLCRHFFPHRRRPPRLIAS